MVSSVHDSFVLQKVRYTFHVIGCDLSVRGKCMMQYSVCSVMCQVYNTVVALSQWC